MTVFAYSITSRMYLRSAFLSISFAGSGNFSRTFFIAAFESSFICASCRLRTSSIGLMYFFTSGASRISDSSILR